MQQITSLLMIVSVNQVTLSKPINNGLTLKLNPITVNEVRPKTFGALFAKNSQELTFDANRHREFISKAYFSRASDFTTVCSNEIGEILFPFQSFDESNPLLLDAKLLNIPIIQQPFNDYRIVVATAPKNIKIFGPDAKPLVVYIMFPEEEASDSKSIKIPSIYFVTKPNNLPKMKKREKFDPVLIVDNNRTVTGLKSKEVAKFVKFKSKLTNRVNQVPQRLGSKLP